MSYQRLFYLKYKKGISTYELIRRFPEEIDRVSEVAMLDIPEETLREIVLEERAFDHLMKLKKRLSLFLNQKSPSL